MPNTPPLVNGRSRDWAQVELSLLGRKVVGVTAIDYDEETEMEDNYGAGQEPVSRGHGNTKYTGSLTLYAEEVEALQSVAPSGKLQLIPEFVITVSYLKGTKVMTDVLQNVRFKKNSRKLKQGDKNVPVELPLILAGIKWGK